MAERTTLFTSPRGTMWITPEAVDPAPPFEAIARSPSDARLLVVPHVTAINFLMLRRGSADGMFAYLPMDFHRGYRDAAVIARWERNPPDLVLWYKWIMQDMGDQLFGVTYAVEAGRWLRTHYEPVTNPYASVVLLRRRAGGLHEPAGRPMRDDAVTERRKQGP